MSEVEQGAYILPPPLPIDIAAPRPSEPVFGVGSGAKSLGFDDFYQSHRSEIGKALAFTLGSVSLAEEAVDEAMARAYQRWSVVSSYDNPAGWVYRAGLNWGKSWKRSTLRRKRREEKVAQRSVALGEPTPAASGATVELFEALNTLPLSQRSVVVLRHYCDWSVAETAGALGISEGTVKSRSARGLSRLRIQLDGERDNG